MRGRLVTKKLVGLDAAAEIGAEDLARLCQYGNMNCLQCVLKLPAQFCNRLG